MKVSAKSFIITTSFLTWLLLGGFSCCGAQVTIIVPPQNTTTCRGSEVTIGCGYRSNITFPVTWIINGTSFNQSAIENSSLYQLNYPTDTIKLSLTVFSVNGTTTFQCIIQSTPNTTSRPGTVMVTDDKIELDIVSAINGCGYFYLSWKVNDNETLCKIRYFSVELSFSLYGNGLFTSKTSYNFTNLSDDTPYKVTVFGTIKPSAKPEDASTTVASTFVRTVAVRDPAPVMVKAIPEIFISWSYINVSWQVPKCVKSIRVIAYNIIVMDQYSPATIKVRPNVSSVRLDYLTDNGTVIRTNRIYTITVLAIGDQGTSYPSDPVVVSTYDLGNCKATSSSIGTITVSCYTSLEILVTLTCTNNCTNPELITYGNSPLTVRGLDPGVMYSVVINVFDGSHVVLSDQLEVQNITVMSDKSGTGGSSCEDSAVAAIIGGVMGGTIVMLIIIIIILICCLISYKKKGNSAYDGNDLQRSSMLKNNNSY